MSHVIFTYSEITPYILLGTNLCCSGHGSKLKELGVDCDISLEHEQVEVPEGIGSFHWIPVEDHGAPTINQLLLGTTILEEAEDNKIHTYVHCRNGHGRSPTLVVAYLMKKGMSLEKAHGVVKEKRPEIALTENQIVRLQEFENI